MRKNDNIYIILNILSNYNDVTVIPNNIIIVPINCFKVMISLKNK